VLVRLKAAGAPPPGGGGAARAGARSQPWSALRSTVRRGACLARGARVR